MGIKHAVRVGPASPSTPGSRVGLSVVAFLAVAIASLSVGMYASQPLETLGANSPVARTYAEGSPPLRVAFYAHVVTGSVALLLGPVQFSTRLRRRFTAAHRVSGRIYVAAVAIGGVSGLVIAPSNSAGIIGTLGFGSLAVLWLATGAMAFTAARRRELERHRAWMIRNYSLTFAAVTLRLWLPLLIVVFSSRGGSGSEAAFDSAYLVVPFLAWVPNLLVAEWLVWRRRGLAVVR